MMVAGPALAELQLAGETRGDALALCRTGPPAARGGLARRRRAPGSGGYGRSVSSSSGRGTTGTPRPYDTTSSRWSGCWSARAQLPGKPFRPSGTVTSVQRARACPLRGGARQRDVRRGQRRWRGAVAACAAAGMEWEARRRRGGWPPRSSRPARAGADVTDLLRRGAPVREGRGSPPPERPGRGPRGHGPHLPCRAATARCPRRLQRRSPG